jgi:hypothetical protein
MPIPNPRFDETGEGGQKKYISRCYEAIQNEYPSEVAFGICYSKWKEKKMMAIARLRKKR